MHKADNRISLDRTVLDIQINELEKKHNQLTHYSVTYEFGNLPKKEQTRILDKLKSIQTEIFALQNRALDLPKLSDLELKFDAGKKGVTHRGYKHRHLSKKKAFSTIPIRRAESGKHKSFSKKIAALKKENEDLKIECLSKLGKALSNKYKGAVLKALLSKSRDVNTYNAVLLAYSDNPEYKDLFDQINTLSTFEEKYDALFFSPVLNTVDIQNKKNIFNSYRAQIKRNSATINTLNDRYEALRYGEHKPVHIEKISIDREDIPTTFTELADEYLNEEITSQYPPQVGKINNNKGFHNYAIALTHLNKKDDYRAMKAKLAADATPIIILNVTEHNCVYLKRDSDDNERLVIDATSLENVHTYGYPDAESHFIDFEPPAEFNKSELVSEFLVENKAYPYQGRGKEEKNPEFVGLIAPYSYGGDDFPSEKYTRAFCYNENDRTSFSDIFKETQHIISPEVAFARSLSRTENSRKIASIASNSKQESGKISIHRESLPSALKYFFDAAIHTSNFQTSGIPLANNPPMRRSLRESTNLHSGNNYEMVSGFHTGLNKNIVILNVSDEYCIFMREDATNPGKVIIDHTTIDNISFDAGNLTQFTTPRHFTTGEFISDFLLSQKTYPQEDGQIPRLEQRQTQQPSEKYKAFISREKPNSNGAEKIDTDHIELQRAKGLQENYEDNFNLKKEKQIQIKELPQSIKASFSKIKNLKRANKVRSLQTMTDQDFDKYLDQTNLRGTGKYQPIVGEYKNHPVLILSILNRDECIILYPQHNNEAVLHQVSLEDVNERVFANAISRGHHAPQFTKRSDVIKFIPGY